MKIYSKNLNAKETRAVLEAVYDAIPNGDPAQKTEIVQHFKKRHQHNHLFYEIGVSEAVLILKEFK
jgi:hypothetical protein